MAGIPAKGIGWACECENVLGETLKCLCGRNIKQTHQTSLQKSRNRIWNSET